MYCCHCGARIDREAWFCRECDESVVSSPLGYILAARTESELREADDYCRMQIRTAALNRHKRLWKGIQRSVGRRMQSLSLTEDHITAYNWSSYHHVNLMESKLCGCFHCLEVFPPHEIEEWIIAMQSLLQESLQQFQSDFLENAFQIQMNRELNTNSITLNLCLAISGQPSAMRTTLSVSLSDLKAFMLTLEKQLEQFPSRL